MNTYNRIFLIISLLLSVISIDAQNNLKVKFDDGGIVQWDFPDTFEPSIVDKNIRDIYEPMLKLSGREVEIFIPLEYIEWTVQSPDRIIFEREWSDDWGWLGYEYTLSEKDGKIVIGNLTEDTAVDVCKDYEGKECRYLTVTGEVERDPKDGYNVFMLNSVCIFVYPK